MRTPLAAAAVVTLLTLAGCGGTAQPEAAPADNTQNTAEAPAEPEAEESLPAGGMGDYHTLIDGAEITFTLPGSPDSGELAEKINAYREKAGLEPTDFITFDIDNMAGTEETSITSLTIVTEDGDQVSAEAYISDQIDEAQAEFDFDDEGYDEGTDLYNETLDTSLKPGAKGTLAVPMLEEFDTVAFVYVGTFTGEYPAVSTSVPIEESVVDTY